MRLVCPRCGAQYEIDGAAIPPAGRDVECSACDHVWRALPPPESFDPAARPQLSRPLSDSVIEILREEAARELEVRAAERRSRRAAERAAAFPAVPEAQDPAEEGQGRALADDASRASAPLVDTGAPPAIGPKGGMDDEGMVPGAAGAVVRDAVSLPAPASPVQTAPGGDTAAAGHVVAADAAPAGGTTRMSAVPAASDPAPAPPVPMASATGSRRGYDAGFGLAVILAVAVVALYALAPRLSGPGPIGSVIAEWRGEMDKGRDWLATKGEAITGRKQGERDGE